MLTDQAQDVMVTDRNTFFRRLAGFHPWAPTVTSWDNLNINLGLLKPFGYAFHQTKMVLVSVCMGHITLKSTKQCGLVADPVPR